jgi:hypothetical protein
MMTSASILWFLLTEPALNCSTASSESQSISFSSSPSSSLARSLSESFNRGRQGRFRKDWGYNVVGVVARCSRKWKGHELRRGDVGETTTRHKKLFYLGRQDWLVKKKETRLGHLKKAEWNEINAQPGSARGAVITYMRRLSRYCSTTLCRRAALGWVRLG